MDASSDVPALGSFDGKPESSHSGALGERLLVQAFLPVESPTAIPG
jgi:hypothetical protein